MKVLGIDVGGTKTALGVVDCRTGKVGARAILQTPRDGAGAAFLVEVAEAARRIDRAAALPVGIGLCELVGDDGSVRSHWRIGWTAAEIAVAFAAWPRLVLEADVRAAAVAEARCGAGRHRDHWLYANAGTGIAAVLMIGGVPYRGSAGLGMAFGMSPANLTAPETDTPSIEALAGGAGLAEDIARAGLEVAGDIDRLMADRGAILGRALALMANMLDPEAVVLGGGVALSSPAYLGACREAFQRTLWHRQRVLPPLVPAALGADAGLVGAALSVRS